MRIVLKRRAIYTALREFLSEKEALVALKLWEAQFVEAHNAALSRFVVQICHTEALKKLRMPMLNSIVAKLEAPEALLLSDPGSQLHVDFMTASEEEAAFQANAENILFVLLMQTIWQSMNEETEAHMRQFTAAHLMKMSLAAPIKAKLSNWIINKDIKLLCNLELSVLQKLINLNYVALCEYFGPIKADVLLSQAIRQVEPQAEVLGFNLHDLL